MSSFAFALACRSVVLDNPHSVLLLEPFAEVSEHGISIRGDVEHGWFRLLDHALGLLENLPLRWVADVIGQLNALLEIEAEALRRSEEVRLAIGVSASTFLE